MPTYATETTVSSEKSRAEIERTLTRYGATSFAYMSSPGKAMIAFEVRGRQVRFEIPLPPPGDYAKTPTGKPRAASAQQAAYEQAARQRWRAMALVVKAKLEAVESGITEFDEEFYAHIILPNGRTVYEETHQQVATIIETGHYRPLAITRGDA
jgi:hypothetical protein